MAKRENHYEAAFEHYLRARQVPYVAVDEAKRALWDDGSLKSLDFIVSASGCENLLVDVKGRRFPSGLRKRYWKNWSTRDDLVSLARWEQLFGDGFTGVLVFAYLLAGNRSPLPTRHLFEFRRQWYGFVAVRRSDYAAWSRQISPKWDTVAVNATHFRRLAVPLHELLERGDERLTHATPSSAHT